MVVRVLHPPPLMSYSKPRGRRMMIAKETDLLSLETFFCVVSLTYARIIYVFPVTYSQMLEYISLKDGLLLFSWENSLV